MFLTTITMFAITNPVLPGIGNQPGEIVIGNIISAVVGMFLVAGTIVAFLYMMLGALNWTTSAGDKGKLEKAQQQITQAIVGLIILASSWALMLLVGRFTGIGFPNFIIPTVNQVGTGGTGGTGTGGTGSGATGNLSCGCYNGGCATTGTLAPLGSLGNNTFGPCYTCTTSGWADAGIASCPSVSCGTCQ